MSDHPADWYPDPSGKHEHRYWDGTVWTDQGSPLLVHTRAQADALRATLLSRYGADVVVVLDNGRDTTKIKSGLDKRLRDRGGVKATDFPEAFIVDEPLRKELK